MNAEVRAGAASREICALDHEQDGAAERKRLTKPDEEIFVHCHGRSTFLRRE
ncbi:hypothetical protein J2W37_006500 [Variovorax paradoxus]|uniref:Uncharacterized protein n=1 Tax=Variovorax paradoxus TaxID=34073 RepID=A0AAE4C1E6_VARPD|nr:MULTISPECIES: hypothetical protein [Variovorax]MDP9968721.1 hypothetical protein [Variovorax paradoxus]MDR6430232.1 hypothetical protein [Variovorax paradoxus]MDR6456880.1 hypothetical protein [Variovorax paradoxus]